MAFSSTDSDDSEVMSEINMIPLIDVMLVLLIVFMITVPVMTHSIDVNLPQASTEAQRDRPETVRLSVDASGRYQWNQTPIGIDDMQARLTEAAAMEPQPEVHILGDKAVRYEHVATAMAAVQRAGIRKLAFVTEP